MEKTGKKFYTSPASKAFVVAPEGIICQSRGYDPNFNKPFENEEEW